jgi:nucleotide-binding universal stress UspA family protein
MRSEEEMANQIKKILAPTDLSDFSQAGVRYALNLARAVGAEVTVYYVVDRRDLAQHHDGEEEKVGIAAAFQQYERLRKSRQLALARFLNTHFSDLIPWVKIREKVELGVPAKSIVEWAKTDGADLVVISICGKGGAAHQFVGSIAAEVVRNSSCPVLTIPPEPEEAENRQLIATG